MNDGQYIRVKDCYVQNFRMITSYTMETLQIHYIIAIWLPYKHMEFF